MALRNTLEKQLENKTLWWILGGLLVFWWIRKDINDYIKEAETTSAGTDPVARLARQIRNAVNPWGYKIFIELDKAQVETLYECAVQITNYEAVANSYRIQFEENLTERLGKELQQEEFNRFFQLVQAKGGGTVVNPQNAIGRIAIAAGTVDVMDFDKNTTVAKRLKAGETVGKVISSAQFNTSRGYVEYWIVEWTSYVFFTAKGYVEKTKVYLQ